MVELFNPVDIRGVRVKNRIVVSPMCQYSAPEGIPNDWHLVFLGALALGGAGVVFTEATSVDAAGRISPEDTGIYSAPQVEAWERITRFVREHGAIPGIQLAHAGRKAGTYAPWKGGGPLRSEDGPWPTIAPSAIAFNDGWQLPMAMTGEDIEKVVADFSKAARASVTAGFGIVEIHAAHGYLLHQFLSPLSNHRTDEFGGPFENRIRFIVMVADSVRAVLPDEMPLFVRLSCTDWVPGGWTIEESVELAKVLRQHGVDVIDCSSGGAVPGAKIPVGPGYQVPFAERIRKEAKILTGAVGMITEPREAEKVLASGQADLIFLARELLRDPYWPRRAAKELGVELEAPEQFARAW